MLGRKKTRTHTWYTHLHQAARTYQVPRGTATSYVWYDVAPQDRNGSEVWVMSTGMYPREDYGIVRGWCCCVVPGSMPHSKHTIKSNPQPLDQEGLPIRLCGKFTFCCAAWAMYVPIRRSKNRVRV